MITINNTGYLLRERAVFTGEVLPAVFRTVVIDLEVHINFRAAATRISKRMELRVGDMFCEVYSHRQTKIT